MNANTAGCMALFGYVIGYLMGRRHGRLVWRGKV